jgi:hypothetical protein
MKHITEAWFENERVEENWVRIGVRVGSKVHYGRISNSALAELAARARSTRPEDMNAQLLLAVRSFVRHNKYVIVPSINSPLYPVE